MHIVCLSLLCRTQMVNGDNYCETQSQEVSWLTTFSDGSGNYDFSAILDIWRYTFG